MADARETFFENHPDPMWVFDIETLRFLDVNNAAVQRYGYSREQFLGMSIADIRPREDVPALHAIVGALHEGLGEPLLSRHRLKSGDIISVHITGHSLQFQGRRARLICARNVTRMVELEREREEALQREAAARQAWESIAQRFQSLFAAVPGKFMVLSPVDFEILAVSDAFLQATRNRREDLVGRRLFESFSAEQASQAPEGMRHLRESLERVLATRRPDTMPVQAFPTRDAPGPEGKLMPRYWCSVNAPVLDAAGNIAYIFHKVEDVTDLVREGGVANEEIAALLDAPAAFELALRTRELKHRAQRLEAQVAELRQAQQLLAMATWTLDLDSGRLAVSDNFHQLFGIAARDFTCTLDGYLALVHPAERSAVRDSLVALGCAGHSHYQFRQRIIRPDDGRTLHMMVVGEFLPAAGGRVLTCIAQDVTSQFEAAQELGKMAALSSRLAMTLESISDAFFTLDHEWRFTYLNSQAGRLLSRDREALLGKVVWDEFPEAAGTIFQAEYERVMRTGETARFDQEFAPLGLRLRVSAYRVPEGVAVYFSDITHQHQQESQLRLLQAAAERMSDVLLITEAEPIDAPDGPRIVYVNQAFERHTGYSREEAIGRTPRILQGPKTQTDELARIRRAMERWQPVRAELINYTRSGEEIWLELDIAPIADATGWYTHWVAVERDVTERRRAGELARINDERFRLIARATNDVVWDWDLVADTVWWNDGMLTLFGYAPEVLEPGAESWTRRVHPDDLPRVHASIQAAIDGTDSSWSFEYRFMHADGRALTVIDRGFVIRDASGKAMRMLGSMVDITERLQLDAQLRQSQKLEAVGHLTGGVAHDFNNLLTVILGNSTLLGEALAHDPRLQGLAAMTEAAAQRGAELINRMLAFSRRQALDPKVTDVNRLVSGLEAMFRRTLPEDIELEFVRAGGLWAIEIDPGQLEVALLNLVVNARDAMPDGGRLTIETANAHLDDAYARQHLEVAAGQYVMVAVSDSGTGMSPQVLQQVFDPFFTTKEVGKGSGLGLSMVYGFVKQSRGHVRIYSEPGQGTTVKLYFPRVLATETAIEPPRESTRPPGGKEHILVVEDDDLVREHVVGQLQALGYRVTPASSGQQALGLLAGLSDLALLFTDVVMPGGMSGRELARQVQRLRPEVKVLFTSGYTENAVVHNGRLDPGVQLLSKPYRRRALAEKVRQVLDG